MPTKFQSTKPIILAICGKSATGKTNLSRWLTSDLTARGIKCCEIVSDTTRPVRVGEFDGKDYHFVSEEEFSKREHLEESVFRNWHYGTPEDAIKDGINIGVFNVEGMKSLLSYRRKYDIIPVLLEDKLMVRLHRSYDREGKWHWEYIRRAMADRKDFKHFKKHYLPLFKHIIVLNNVDGVVAKSNIIYQMLRKKIFITPGQTQIKHLI